jgi:hypothetical protein
MAQTPDEKTYVEFPFIDQLKGMWTLFLVPTLQSGNEETFYLARVKSRLDPKRTPFSHPSFRLSLPDTQCNDLQLLQHCRLLEPEGVSGSLDYWLLLLQQV